MHIHICHRIAQEQVYALYMHHDPLGTDIRLGRLQLVLGLNHRVHGRVELVAALQEGKADDKEVLEGDAARLLDELARGGSGATGGDQVTAGQLYGLR